MILRIFSYFARPHARFTGNLAIERRNGAGHVDRATCCRRTLVGFLLVVGVVMMMPGGSIGQPGPAATADAPPQTTDAVRVARLNYGDRQSKCFSSRFLALTRRVSHARVHDQLIAAALGEAELFDYPMAVMSGKGPFTLTDHEAAQLGRYLQRGGFVLASTTCSDADWSASFRQAVQASVPDMTWQAIEPGHVMMSCLYEIDSIRTVQRVETPLLGGYLAGRLAVVFSPVDLRDAEHLGPDCCCCGANAIINARYINANALMYALGR